MRVRFSWGKMGPLDFASDLRQQGREAANPHLAFEMWVSPIVRWLAEVGHPPDAFHLLL